MKATASHESVGGQPALQFWRTTTAVRVFALSLATGTVLSQGVLVESAPMLVVLGLIDNGGWDGFSANHVGISTNGSTATTWNSDVYQRTECYGMGSDIGCMSNGALWTVTIQYDGAKLSMSMRDETMPVDFTPYPSLAIDIASVLGTNQAYVGFTSATGAASQNHDLLNWTFADTAELPVDVLEPGSMWTQIFYLLLYLVLDLPGARYQINNYEKIVSKLAICNSIPGFCIFLVQFLYLSAQSCQICFKA